MDACFSGGASPGGEDPLAMSVSLSVQSLNLSECVALYLLLLIYDDSGFPQVRVFLRVFPGSQVSGQGGLGLG